jgi:hypothetical protein
VDIHRVYRALGRGSAAAACGASSAHSVPTATDAHPRRGGTRGAWERIDSAPRVTLLNLDRVALEGGEPRRIRGGHRVGLRLPHADGTFDVAFCNSVIEHVGARDARAALAPSCAASRAVCGCRRPRAASRSSRIS